MKVKNFNIEYTGGNVYVAWGEFEEGNYFSIGSDLLMIFDENEFLAMDSDNYDGYEWEQEHTIDSFSYNCDEYLDVLKQIYDKTKNHDMDLFNEIEKEV